MTSALVHVSENNGHPHIMDKKSMTAMLRGISRKTGPTVEVAKHLASLPPHTQVNPSKVAEATGTSEATAKSVMHRIAGKNPGTLAREKDNGIWVFTTPGEVTVRDIPKRPKYLYTNSGAYAFRGYLAKWPKGESRTTKQIRKDLSGYSEQALHAAIRTYGLLTGALINLREVRLPALYERTGVAVEAPEAKEVPKKLYPSAGTGANHKVLAFGASRPAGTWWTRAEFFAAYPEVTESAWSNALNRLKNQGKLEYKHIGNSKFEYRLAAGGTKVPEQRSEPEIDVVPQSPPQMLNLSEAVIGAMQAANGAWVKLATFYGPISVQVAELPDGEYIIYGRTGADE